MGFFGYIRNSRWPALPIVALVFGLSAAPVLSRMTCLMSGHSVWGIGSMDDCCPEGLAHGLAVIQPTCCDLAQAVPAKEDYRPEPSLVLAMATGHTSAVMVESTVRVSDIVPGHLVQRPPPLSSPARLSRMGLFLL